jgi:3-phosphoshikimate 1-carboxyvinyltransferase
MKNLKNKIEITSLKPNTKISSDITIPGSKSITNRAFLLSALSVLDADPKKCIILHDCLESDDTIAFCNCLIVLGFKIDRSCGDYKFFGVSRADILGYWRKNNLSIYCHDAGTAVRFLLPFIAALGGGVSISASEQMTNRPIQALLKALQDLGAKFSYDNIPGSLPLKILAYDKSREYKPALSGGDLVIETKESSQFISGVLMVSPLARNPTQIQLTQTRRQSYIDMTIKMMQDFGFKVDVIDKNTYQVDNNISNISNISNNLNNYYIEPDASTASYFFAVAALTGGVIRVKNFNYKKSLQGDVGFLSVLEKMGAKVSYKKDNNKDNNKDNDISDIGYTIVHGSEILKGFGLDNPIDVSAFSDTFMTLAAIAPFADKPIHITGISHTRKQESDRVHAMAVGLRAIGVKLEERQDDLIIYPADINQLKGAEVSSFGDHRIAMSMALVGLKVPGVVIENADAVSKTCPDYFKLLDSIF